MLRIIWFFIVKVNIFTPGETCLKYFLLLKDILRKKTCQKLKSISIFSRTRKVYVQKSFFMIKISSDFLLKQWHFRYTTVSFRALNVQEWLIVLNLGFYAICGVLSQKPELGTFEWWISGLMLDPLFFLISILNNACSPFVIHLQIN